MHFYAVNPKFYPLQVGAANVANPRAMETIAEEMAAWMDKNGVKTLDEIRGCARSNG